MQDVNFQVSNIFESGFNDNMVNVTVKFNGEDSESILKRKYFKDFGRLYFCIIDGCRVYFRKSYDYTSYELIKVERVYDTKGKKRKNTANQIKKHNTSTEQRQETELPKDSDFELEEIEEVKEEPIDNVEVIEESTEEEEVEYVDDDWGEEKEIRHEKYNVIKTCLENNIPIYLAGPAGSGKNYTVEQIAWYLGWNFYFSNSVQQEYKLTGFIDAGGKFHETEFYKACTDENDCIFFLDEIDASIPEVLVLLNAAIANGYFEFPNGRVDIEHVHFVAAGNTVGSGADEMYTGRMVLDQATLDRFAIIEFDYDKKVEMNISKGNKQLVDFIHELRDKAKQTGIRATFSYRCIEMTTKLEKAGMDVKDILKIAIFKGMDKDTINTFNLFGTSKYYKALRELQV
jgi:MoxR-like ATPase